MTGLNVATCYYVDSVSVSVPFIPSFDYTTSGDAAAITCGYYVEYEWSGDNDVWFEIHSMNAIARTVSAFALVAVSALLL